jgi:flagellin-like hook-associated protein FlgL
VHQSIRERESLESVRRLSSGEKQNTGDGGNISFAAGLASRTNTERVARDNLDNAIALTQYQMSSLQTVDAIVSRMSDLAYKAADFMSTSSERSQLDREFQSLSETLKGISNEKQADQVLFDPMASKYVDALVPPPPEVGDDQRQISPPFDIEAYRGTIHLWWYPMGARDRVQLKLGDSVFFDSGEYRTPSKRIDTSELTGEDRYGDYFKIDFGPNESAISIPDPNGSNPNVGDRASLSYGGQPWTEWTNYPTGITNPSQRTTGPDFSSSLTNYPKGKGTDGKSTILTSVVNETYYEEVNKRVTPFGSVWNLALELERKPVLGPEALTTSEGLQYQMQTKGFSSLSGLSLTDSVSAADALKMAMREQDNLRHQMGKVATDFSSLTLNREHLAKKTILGFNAVSRIRDTDMAMESVRLAKNMLLHSVTDHSLIHSRHSANKIFDLLF